MTGRYIQFNLNRENTYIRSLVNLGDEKFTFTIRWDEEYDYFLLDIQNLDAEYIVCGVALVNNLIIRKKELPYVLLYTHLNGELYEPTIDCINEFGFTYDDGNEES